MIEFVEGEFGEDYDITLKDQNNNLADLTGYTAGTIKILTPDFLTTKLSKAISLPGSSIARWSIASGDTNYNGVYIAQIELTGTGKNKKTFLIPVNVTRKL